MNNYSETVNSLPFYLIVAAVLIFVVTMCVIFLVKSYKAGIELGMDPKALKKVMTSSATFTLLPSISILLGVVALSGTLGVPFSWLRLSVIGSLQYELNVADIAAKAYGMLGLRAEDMSVPAFITIALVMTAGILGGLFCSIFFLKKYLNKLSAKPKKEESGEKKPSFGDHATTAMFVGLCAAFIGAYVGQLMPSAGEKLHDIMPFFTAVVAAVVMAVFEFLIQKKKMSVLENFSLAASMLVAMAAAVIFQLVM